MLQIGHPYIRNKSFLLGTWILCTSLMYIPYLSGGIHSIMYMCFVVLQVTSVTLHVKHNLLHSQSTNKALSIIIDSELGH